MKRVEIIEYQFNWGEAFVLEAQSIRNRLQDLSFFIDHVGSTSIQGLSAKPIVDILISVEEWGSACYIVEALQGLGYDTRENLPDVPRYFLVKYSSLNSIGYHVHICKPHSEWAQDMINFRDELYSNAKLSKDYANLKADLARTYRNDVDAYALGKKEFIEQALKSRSPRFSVNRLLAHQEAELNRADKCGKHMLLLQFIAAIIAALSVYVTSGWGLLFIALLGLVLLTKWLSLNQSQQTHRAAGDQARRALLFMSGLNKYPSIEEQQRILKKFILPLPDSVLSLEENRFASRKFPGYPRLAELIEESAFWTGGFHHASAAWMGKFLSCCVLLCFIGSIAAIILAPQDDLISFNRALIAVLVFFMSSDMLGLYFSYKRSAASFDEIFHRVEIASLRGYLDEDVSLLVSDYNAVIENSPPPVPFLPKSKSEDLGQRWAIYKAMKRIDSACNTENRRSY
jgi:GrpB-like predicted nucleotidyltransferase (UPF0157 family)